MAISDEDSSANTIPIIAIAIINNFFIVVILSFVIFVVN
jgi:hypothetical protein